MVADIQNPPPPAPGLKGAQAARPRVESGGLLKEIWGFIVIKWGKWMLDPTNSSLHSGRTGRGIRFAPPLMIIKSQAHVLD